MPAPQPPPPPPPPGTAAERPLGGDLPTANRFLFELDGVEVGVFREVSGLEVSLEPETFNEGGQNGFTHKFPSRMSWPNIVFRRGITQSNVLFDWFSKSSGEGFAHNKNKLVRSSGAVTVVDHQGKRLRSWNLLDVFPVRWEGPSLSVDSTDPLQESLEITHHGFRAKTLH